MPVKPTYPGVYIEEIPSGVRTITGVSTAVAAFVDSFARGPANVAVRVFSFADFERDFGGLARTSEASYAIQQFFLNGGTEAWIVRSVSDGTEPGEVAAVASEVVLRSQPAGGGVAVLRLRAGRQLRNQSIDNPGSWGDNLRVEVDYNTRDPTNLFNLTISEVRRDGDRTIVVQTESFSNLGMTGGTEEYVVDKVNQGARLVQASRDPGWPATRPAATGTMGDALAIPAVIPASGTAISVDAGSGPQASTIDYVGAIGTHAALRAHLESAIRRAGETAPEAERPYFAGATVELLGAGTMANPYRYVVRAGRGARPFDPAIRLTLTGAGATALGLAVTANHQQMVLAGGNDGTVPVSANTLIGALLPKTGIFALEDVDLFNILCIPRAADLAPGGMRAVYTAAQTYCEARRAFLVVDIPATVGNLEQMQTWLTDNDGLRHRNAAVYFPRTLVPDRLNGNRPRSVGASGTIAGLYARTDAARGVWKAPAGTDARLRNVESLPYLLTDAQNGALNPLGVNCLRNFPVYSNISWGARTLEGADALASEWKYIPIRRLTLFIEESLYRGTKWVVFEPNDEPLWSQIRLNVGAFMHDLFRQGAFQGATPRDAYFVKCNSETTTQSDINNGIVNIEVGFAPLKPAEFVIIKIQQIAGQLEV